MTLLEVTFRLERPADDSSAYDDRVGDILEGSYSRFDRLGLVTLYGQVGHGDAVTEAIELARRVYEVGGIDVVACDPDLVDLTEVSRRCSVSHEAARQWASGGRRSTTGFPAPSHVIAGRRLWDWVDINSWLVATNSPHADTVQLLTRTERVEVDYRISAKVHRLDRTLWSRAIEPPSRAWTIVAGAPAESVPVRANSAEPRKVPIPTILSAR